MKASNEIAAKVIGDIIAGGMSISGFDIAERVQCEAAEALEEIRLVLGNERTDDKGKLGTIRNIMGRYNLR